MTTHPPDPATEATANKLLPPQRRKQIEIWLDEALYYETLQSCASDKRYGHASDLSTLSFSGALPNKSPRLTATSPACPLCGRYFEGEHPPLSSLDASNPPTDPNPKLNKSKFAFWSLKTAVASLKTKNAEEKYDPTLATRMFLTPPSDNDVGSNNSSSVKHIDSLEDGGSGKQLLEEKMARLKRAQKLLKKSQSKEKA